MKPDLITRREFLKLLGLTPFIFNRWPNFPIAEHSDRSQIGDSLPNFLILVFDAFSASNSSLYGYPRQTTPNIERFSQKATVFHRHYSGGNFTSPGTASILTGTYPWTHRVFQFLGSVRDVSGVPNIFESMSSPYYTFSYTHNPLVYILLHQFRSSIRQLTPVSKLCLANASSIDSVFSEDYPVALEGENLRFRNITYPSSSLLFSPLDTLRRLYLHYSLNREYQERYPRGISRFALESPPGFMYFSLEDAVDWIQKQLQEIPRPFMGYVHLFPPHSPYTTRSEFYNRFQDGWHPPRKPEHFFSDGYSQQFLDEERRLYDESIVYVDAEFGRLFDSLENAGLLKNTYLMLTSDHGEMFERGIAKHNTPTLYEPIVHIPLLISAPGQSQRQDVYTPTSNIDLLPTLCGIAGLPIPPQSEGQGLALTGLEHGDPKRPVFIVEAKENPRNAPLHKATIAMIQGFYKLIYTFGYENYPPTFELYDLEADPEELINLYSETDLVSLTLKDQLLAKLAEVNQQ